MIAIEDVENHILANTNEKMISCLRLAGFHNFVDYMTFSETTLSWMEKYIGIRCSLMSVEERTEYIEEYFLNDPEKYMFPVPLRHRLINAITELHRESERLMQTINENAYINNAVQQPTEPVSPAEIEYNSDSNVKTSVDTSPETSEIKNEMEENNILQPELNNFDNVCRQETMQSINDVQRKFFEEIVQYAADEFIECYLVPKRDFDLMLPDFTAQFYRYTGNYNCLICDCSMRRKSNVSFKIQNNGKIQFSKIKKHLSEHFTVNPDANEVRKQNRVLKRKMETQMKKASTANQHDIPKEMIVAQANATPSRKFLPAQKKKMYTLLSEIMPKPKQVVPQLTCVPTTDPVVVESNPLPEDVPIISVKKIKTDSYDPIVDELQIQEHFETAEVVIEHTTSDNITNYQSDSDIEEKNLTICL